MMVLLSACFLTSCLLSAGTFEGMFCDAKGLSVHATEDELQDSLFAPNSTGSEAELLLA